MSAINSEIRSGVGASTAFTATYQNLEWHPKLTVECGNVVEPAWFLAAVGISWVLILPVAVTPG